MAIPRRSKVLMYSTKRHSVPVLLLIFVCAVMLVPHAFAQGTYKLDVIASTGSSNLTAVGNNVSINDAGKVAFMGTQGGRTFLFVGSGPGSFTNITPGFGAQTNRSFDPAVQINNADQVVATDRVTTFPQLFFVRYWNAQSPDSFVEIGRGTNNLPGYPYTTVLTRPSINNSNQVVFSATSQQGGTTTLLATLKPGGDFMQRESYNEVSFSGNVILRPMIDDSGRIVVRAGNTSSSSIVLYSYQLAEGPNPTPPQPIASIAAFTELGRSPGISDDGSVVGFYGNLASAAFGTTAGRGIFASVGGASGRAIQRVVGTDNSISNFDVDSRIGVNSDGVVVYTAFDSVGNKALFTSQLNSGSASDTPTVVVKQGETIDGLAGVVQDIVLYDPLNDGGDIAFWVSTNAGLQAVVRATLQRLAAPSNLSATAISPNETKLEWTDNSDEEDGFSVEVKIDNDDFRVLSMALGPNTREFFDTGLSPNSTYVYRVRAFKGTTNPTFSDYSNEASVTPILIRVDANRDSNISFEDNSDETSFSKPFNFWLNDDRDVVLDEEQQDVNPTSGQRDNVDNIIAITRDLEDFTRIQIKAPNEIHTTNSNWSCTIQFTEVNDGTPAIRVWSAVTPGTEFLTDENIASDQIISPSLLFVSAGQETAVPLSLFSPDNGNIAALLFEGRNPGKGALTVRLYNSGTKVAEDKVYLSLKSITKMYDHWTAGDSDDRFYTPLTEAIPLETAEDKPEVQTYILFVHGWRVQPWERRAFAETAFKRLWHRGYKGAFGLFSWPTEYLPIADALDLLSLLRKTENRQNYDRSELKAFGSASALHGVLEKLNDSYPEQVRVFAHSMGNVVTSEALRLESESSVAPRLLVHAYVASQAAVSAHAYDESTEPLPDLWPNVFDSIRYGRNRHIPSVPDVYAEYPETGRPYFRDINKAAGKLVNFFNPLCPIVFWVWQANQYTKYDLGWSYAPQDYRNRSGLIIQPKGFYRQTNIGRVRLNFPENRYEIFAHIAPSWSHSLGHQKGVGGPFTTSEEVDLSMPPFSYGSSPTVTHSAQFLSTIQRRYLYYDRLLQTFNLR